MVLESASNLGYYVLGEHPTRVAVVLLTMAREDDDHIMLREYVGELPRIAHGAVVATSLVHPPLIAIIWEEAAMHKIRLHGKGFIPLMLGFGCNIPACLGCRIMETEREQLICAFTASLVPCAARTVVIMGLVADHRAPIT